MLKELWSNLLGVVRLEGGTDGLDAAATAAKGDAKDRVSADGGWVSAESGGQGSCGGCRADSGRASGGEGPCRCGGRLIRGCGTCFKSC